MQKHRKHFVLFFISIVLLLSVPTNAEELKLNRRKVTIQYGKTYQLRTNQKVFWTSSNRNVAAVSLNGKVTAGNNGTVIITAMNKDGQKKKCKLTVQNYVIKRTGNKECPQKITIYADGTSKTYKVYDQKEHSDVWIQERGCSACAIAMVSSAYGQSQSPMDVHYGTKDQAYSESYYLAKLGNEVKINNDKSLTLHTITQILNNTGIKSHMVYKYEASEAIKEIKSNLKAGRPVIITCHNKTVEGNRLAGYTHILVIAGIDINGKVIILDPNGGVVNRTPHTGEFSLTVSQLVKRHMFQCKGNGEQLYYTGKKNSGGYILIDQ